MLAAAVMGKPERRTQGKQDLSKWTDKTAKMVVNVNS